MVSELTAQQKYFEQKLAQQAHDAASHEIDMLHVNEERSRLTDELRARREEVAAARAELAAERERRLALEQARAQLQFECSQRLEQVCSLLLCPRTSWPHTLL